MIQIPIDDDIRRALMDKDNLGGGITPRSRWNLTIVGLCRSTRSGEEEELERLLSLADSWGVRDFLDED